MSSDSPPIYGRDCRPNAEKLTVEVLGAYGQKEAAVDTLGAAIGNKRCAKLSLFLNQGQTT